MHIFSVRTISRQNGQKLQDFVRYAMFDVSAKFMISHKVGNFPKSGHFPDEKWEINHLTGKKNERTVSNKFKFYESHQRLSVERTSDSNEVVKTVTKKVVTYASIRAESRGLWGQSVVCYGGTHERNSLICNNF